MLLCCIYNPNKSLTENYLRQLQKQLEASSERYKHFRLWGISMLMFLTLQWLHFALCLSSEILWRNQQVTRIQKIPAAYIFFVLQKSFEPLPPKIIKCKNYKNFDEDEFRYLFKMTSLNFLNEFANLKKNIWELITPILLKKNLVRQSCKNQGFVMHILKIKLEQLG